MKNRFYDLNTYFKNIFGHRVHKITVDAGMSCPNRDGTLSTDGCIYCNQSGSGTGFFQKGISVSDQILNARKYVIKRYKAKKFIAYFQSYTNTYAPIDKLKQIYDEALAVEDVAGLSIGTRPDCVNEEILTLLQEYAQTYLIWIEYGLQSVHDKTLCLINRGHDFNAFQKAVAATQNRGINICAHVILGLPGESKKQMLETAKSLSQMGIDGLKFHMLYVIKGTKMEALLAQGTYTCITQEAYVDILCEFLTYLPENMVIQRLTSDPHPRELVAPLWSLKKKETIELIKKTLEEKDLFQGKNFKKQ
ncbi:MAG: TIGR01212 family radical SAM protein [Desulfobacteraceae bacterium]|nr:TIGR01212 family radical SAM protein [Desulfobacteraceae bacterium]MBC2756613.1 TIGR01212 family radical SAM protein [Desulfobacteraceae bacterium]